MYVESSTEVPLLHLYVERQKPGLCGFKTQGSVRTKGPHQDTKDRKTETFYSNFRQFADW